jgi:mRNA interferase MazF
MAGGSGYAGKPRPVLIIQDDAFAERDSVTVCLITTDPMDLSVFRVPVEPTADNGLRAASRQPPDGGQGHDRAAQPPRSSHRPLGR